MFGRKKRDTQQKQTLQTLQIRIDSGDEGTALTLVDVRDFVVDAIRRGVSLEAGVTVGTTKDGKGLHYISATSRQAPEAFDPMLLGPPTASIPVIQPEPRATTSAPAAPAPAPAAPAAAAVAATPRPSVHEQVFRSEPVQQQPVQYPSAHESFAPVEEHTPSYDTTPSYDATPSYDTTPSYDVSPHDGSSNGVSEHHPAN